VGSCCRNFSIWHCLGSSNESRAVSAAESPIAGILELAPVAICFILWCQRGLHRFKVTSVCELVLLAFVISAIYYLPSYSATMATQVLVAANALATIATSGSAATGFLGSRKDVQSCPGFAEFNVNCTSKVGRRRRSFAAAVLVRNPPSGITERTGNSENGSSRTGAGSNGAVISNRGTGNGAAVAVAADRGQVYRGVDKRFASPPVKKLKGINSDSPLEREAEARAVLRAADAIQYDPVNLYERYSKMPFKV
jgi:hypothetical protein